MAVGIAPMAIFYIFALSFFIGLVPNALRRWE